MKQKYIYCRQKMNKSFLKKRLIKFILNALNICYSLKMPT